MERKLLLPEVVELIAIYKSCRIFSDLIPITIVTETRMPHPWELLCKAGEVPGGEMA